jgi:hypothetical protein
MWVYKVRLYGTLYYTFCVYYVADCTVKISLANLGSKDKWFRLKVSRYNQPFICSEY